MDSKEASSTEVHQTRKKLISDINAFRLSANDGKPSEQEYHIYSSGDEIMIVFENGAQYQAIFITMSVRDVLRGSVRKYYSK